MEKNYRLIVISPNGDISDNTFPTMLMALKYADILILDGEKGEYHVILTYSKAYSDKVICNYKYETNWKKHLQKIF